MGRYENIFVTQPSRGITITDFMFRDEAYIGIGTKLLFTSRHLISLVLSNVFNTLHFDRFYLVYVTCSALENVSYAVNSRIFTCIA